MTAIGAEFPQPSRLRLVFQFEGLLSRLGRPVPQSLGMLQALAHIADRLKQPVMKVEVMAAPVPGSTTEQDGAAPDGAAPSLYPDFAGLPLELRLGTQVRNLKESLDPGERLIFFSALSWPVELAIQEGIRAHRVADDGGGDPHCVSYLDVPRLVEEALRIPTARPVSPDSRKGEVVWTEVRNLPRQELRTIILRTARQDPHSDWAEVDHRLYLYVEIPEVADELSATPGWEKLPFLANKAKLTFQTETGDKHRLLDNAGNHQEIAGQPTPPLPDPRDPIPWQSARHGTLPRPALAKPAPGTLPAATVGEELRITPEERSALAAALVVDRKEQLARIHSHLEKNLPEESALDLITTRDGEGIVMWSSPFGNDEEEGIIALLHLLADDPEIAASQVIMAADLAKRIRSKHPALAWIQAIAFTGNFSAENPGAILAHSELRHLAAIVEIGVSRDSGPAIEIHCDPELRGLLATDHPAALPDNGKNESDRARTYDIPKLRLGYPLPLPEASSAPQLQSIAVALDTLLSLRTLP